MKNRILVLFFLIGSVLNLSSAKIDSTDTIKKIKLTQLITSLESDSLALNLNRLEQKLISISTDTCAKKTVSFNANFGQKYIQDEEFDYYREKVDLNFFTRLLNYLKKLVSKLFGMAPLSDQTSWNWIIIKVLSGAIILTILYFIIRYAMNHKGRWIFEKKNESIEIDLNNTEQLIESADFEKLIAEIENQANTRQSIRLYYLWLLKDLKEKNLIVWLPEKTNSDYLYEIVDDKLKKQFSYLSYIYNYIWYGEFSITDVDYLEAKKAFLNFLKN